MTDISCSRRERERERERKRERERERERALQVELSAPARLETNGGKVFLTLALCVLDTTLRATAPCYVGGYQTMLKFKCEDCVSGET